jgi:hypothetical protein
MEGGGHADGLEEDEGRRRGELEDYELGGGAEAGVEGANVSLVGEGEVAGGFCVSSG